MDKEIADNVISALGGIVSAIVTTAVPLLLKNRALNRRLREPVAVARGLAVGYFYNFLHKIGSELGRGGMDFQLDPKSDAASKFLPDSVTITFVTPKRLGKSSAHNVENEAGRYPVGLVRFPSPDRPRAVNYSIAKNAAGTPHLTIIDPVRPCFALTDYLACQLKINAGSEHWRKLELATLSEFKRTIEDLRTKDDAGAHITRVSWQEVE